MAVDTFNRDIIGVLSNYLDLKTLGKAQLINKFWQNTTDKLTRLQPLRLLFEQEPVVLTKGNLTSITDECILLTKTHQGRTELTIYDIAIKKLTSIHQDCLCATPFLVNKLMFLQHRKYDREDNSTFSQLTFHRPKENYAPNRVGIRTMEPVFISKDDLGNVAFGYDESTLYILDRSDQLSRVNLNTVDSSCSYQCINQLSTNDRLIRSYSGPSFLYRDFYVLRIYDIKTGATLHQVVTEKKQSIGRIAANEQYIAYETYKFETTQHASDSTAYQVEVVVICAKTYKKKFERSYFSHIHGGNTSLKIEEGKVSYLERAKGEKVFKIYDIETGELDFEISVLDELVKVSGDYVAFKKGSALEIWNWKERKKLENLDCNPVKIDFQMRGKLFLAVEDVKGDVKFWYFEHAQLIKAKRKRDEKRAHELAIQTLADEFIDLPINARKPSKNSNCIVM
jgi:hypothetical protein